MANLTLKSMNEICHQFRKRFNIAVHARRSYYEVESIPMIKNESAAIKAAIKIVNGPLAANKTTGNLRCSENKETTFEKSNNQKVIDKKEKM